MNMVAKRSSISFLVATYCMADSVIDMLDSICQAMTTGDQLVIVDDGSPDATAQICQEWLALHGVLYTLISQSNRGVCASRNAALAVAQGTYLLFLDGDDILHPAVITLARDILDTHQPDLLEFDFDYWQPGTDQVPYRSRPKSYLPRKLLTDKEGILCAGLNDRAWALWGRLIRRSLISGEQGTPFFPEWLSIDDVPSTPRILSRTRSLYYLPEPILSYRTNTVNSLSKQRSSRHCLDIGRSTAVALQEILRPCLTSYGRSAIHVWAGRMFYEALRILQQAPDRSASVFSQLYSESIGNLFENTHKLTSELRSTGIPLDKKIAREIDKFSRFPRLNGYTRWLSSHIKRRH